jgi:hypothetical protein
MINLNHGSGPLRKRPLDKYDVTQEINELIDQGLIDEDKKEERRKYIGASEVGDECMRKVALKWHGAPRDTPKGRILRIRKRGHAGEARLISWLRRGGLKIVDRKPGTEEQIGFSQADGKIAGHVDGIVVSGDLDLPYPLLLELKCLMNKYWNEIRKFGLKEARYEYYVQLNMYMAYLSLTHCLFGAENSDSMESMWMIFPLDVGAAQDGSDRGVDIFKSDYHNLPSRISNDPKFYKCKMCDVRETCWKV